MVLKDYSIPQELLSFSPFWKAEKAMVQSLWWQQLHCDKHSHRQEANIGKSSLLTLPRLSLYVTAVRLLLTLRDIFSP